MHTPPVSAESVRAALDASMADDRTLLLRATTPASQERVRDLVLQADAEFEESETQAAS